MRMSKAGLEQVRGEGVAQCLTRRVLGDAGALDGVLDGALDDGGVHVVTTLLPRAPVDPAALLWEDPLPAPLGRRTRVPTRERVGESDAAPAVGEVRHMHGAGMPELLAQGGLDGARERGDAVLVAFATADDELTGGG